MTETIAKLTNAHPRDVAKPVRGAFSRRWIERLACMLTLAAALACWPNDAHGAEPETAPNKPGSFAVDGWQRWPAGRSFETAVARPPASTISRSFCHFQAPICVHSPVGVPANTGLESLDHAYAVWRKLRIQAQLPWPVADGEPNGSPKWDIYLDPEASRLRIGTELPLPSLPDRAASFAVVPIGRSHCERDFAIAQGAAVAGLLASDGGASRAWLATASSYLAMRFGGCTTPALLAVDEYQAHPQLKGMQGQRSWQAAPLLPWYLEGQFGTGATGSLISALTASGGQRTGDRATRYQNKPDILNVLHHMVGGRKRKLHDLWQEFAIARAFMGNRDDGLHLPSSRFLGELGRVRFDATYKVSQLPRNLGFNPLAPLGSVYVWIDLEGADRTKPLRFQMEWERPSSMRWSLVGINQAGQELRRVEVTLVKGASETGRSFENLEGLAAVIAVGTNMGEVGPGHPFRLDEYPYESRGGTIAIFHRR